MCPQQLDVSMLSQQYSNFRQKRELSENVVETSSAGVIRANLFSKRTKAKKTYGDSSKKRRIE